MKSIYKILLAAIGVVTVLAACNKVDKLPFYGVGSAPTLSVSLNTVAATAADSSNKVISFSWTDPKHSTAPASYKYVLEIDSAGRNFSNAASRTTIGSLSDSLTGKQLNDILLGFGFTFNVAYTIEARVISSYGNNNERLISNSQIITATPYRIPPKIDPPASGKLFLVGNATAGGWNNPVPVPTQEFGRIDATTFVGVFDLSGGNQYLILPVNGDWSNKYAVANGTLPGLSDGGEFGYNFSDNFPGPANSGMYKITVDFQSGRFSAVPYTGAQVPANLYMVGDATPGGWNNPVPVPSQELTRLNSVQFELPSIALDANKQYLLLPVNGDWGNKYAVPSSGLPGLSGGGYFGYNLGDNFPGPAAVGNFKLQINFGINDPTNANRAWFTMTQL
ncbi:MAG: SusE domain-containing protein [Ferruginibacter sp.]|nr:SusE domain-containing protein [Ferruginibacter sp.]